MGRNLSISFEGGGNRDPYAAAILEFIRSCHAVAVAEAAAATQLSSRAQFCNKVGARVPNVRRVCL